MKLSQKYTLIILLSVFIFPLSYLGVNFSYYTIITNLGNHSSGEFLAPEKVEKDWNDFVSSLKGLADVEIKSKLENRASSYPHPTIIWVSKKGELLTSIGKSKESITKWDIDKTIEFMTDQQTDTYFTTQSYLDGANHSGYVFLKIPESDMGSRWEILRDRYAFLWFIALGLFLFLFIFISWLFFKRISNRLIKIQKNMEISNNQLIPTKIEIDKEDEIGQLEHSFNHMVEQLNESREKEKSEEAIRKRIIASLSHDLRTPLAIINGHAHKINQFALSPEIKESLTFINEKVDFIADLIDNLTSFTVLSAGKLPMNKEPTDIVKLVRSSLIAYYPIFEELGFEVDIGLTQPIQWDVDETWFRRILDNIFQNVKRHAAEGKYLSVRTTKRNAVTALEIEDHGPGMEKSSKQKGAGIGLSIVDMMLEQMKLSKTIFSDPSGTTIIITPLDTDLLK